MCGLRGLVSKPESPIINYIKEQNRSTSPFMSFNQEWVQIWILYFMKLVSSIHASSFWLSVVWVWNCACLKTGLNVCHCICVCPWMSMCVCSKQRALLCPYSTSKKASHKEEMGQFIETFNRVLKGIEPLAPTDPKWLRQQLLLQILLFIKWYPSVVFNIYGGY